MSTLDILKAASELFGAVSQEVDGNIQHISNEGLQDLTTNELAQATTKAQENQTIYDANEYSRGIIIDVIIKIKMCKTIVRRTRTITPRAQLIAPPINRTVHTPLFFMIPLTFQRTKVTSFLLVKDQASCCLGVGATMKDWVFVKMTHPTPSVMNIPLEVQGTFYASPDVVDGQLLILYRMSGESVVRKD